MGLQLELMLAERAIAAMAGVMDAKANPGAGATISFELEVASADGLRARRGDRGRWPRFRRSAPHPGGRSTTPPTAWWSRPSAKCSTARPSAWWSTAVEAVEAAKAGRFDVILMDIKMPWMDAGHRRCGRSASSPAPAGWVPIIALTANAEQTKWRHTSPPACAGWSKSRSSRTGCSKPSTKRSAAKAPRRGRGPGPEGEDSPLPRAARRQIASRRASEADARTCGFGSLADICMLWADHSVWRRRPHGSRGADAISRDRTRPP